MFTRANAPSPDAEVYYQITPLAPDLLDDEYYRAVVAEDLMGAWGHNLQETGACACSQPQLFLYEFAGRPALLALGWAVRRG